MVKYIYLFSISLLFFWSCAVADNVTRWHPVDNNTFFQQGVEYSLNEIDSVGVVCGVAEISKENLYLDIEITNHKSSPILFEPSVVNYFYDFGEGIKNKLAFNPELEILRSEINENENIAAQKNSVAVGATLFAAGLLTVAVANSKTASSNDYKKQNTARIYNAVGQLGTEVGKGVLYNSIAKNIEANPNEGRKRFWQNIPFRKSHIFPNESIRGTVVLPVNHEYNSLIKLAIPVETSIFEFNFNQKQYTRSNIHELIQKEKMVNFSDTTSQ